MKRHILLFILGVLIGVAAHVAVKDYAVSDNVSQIRTAANECSGVNA